MIRGEQRDCEFFLQVAPAMGDGIEAASAAIPGCRRPTREKFIWRDCFHFFYEVVGRLFSSSGKVRVLPENSSYQRVTVLPFMSRLFQPFSQTPRR